MKIGIIGTGYVGLVAGTCFADAGHQVFCVDSNPEKIEKLKTGEPPFFEPGLGDLLEKNIKRMSFFANVADAVERAQIIFIAVGTPELPDGSADMEPTFNVLKEICAVAKSPKYIVLKSTVPIGTWQEAEKFCQKHSSQPMEIINNPEFLKQGAAVEDFLHPDRVVIGCKSKEAERLMQELYEPFLKNGKKIIFMDNTSAEMTKYAANSFLALKISFINELALLADRLGADIDNVRRGFTSDSRINPAFFYPGIGYGGSCFPKDVRALIHTGEKCGLNLKLLHAADEVNERQKTILSRRLAQRFGSLQGLRIAIWGLSFKPNTDDVRRAPSLKLIEDLTGQGAKLVAYDPVAIENAKKSCKVTFEVKDSALATIQGADALIIVTEWNEFKAADLNEVKAGLKQPIIFDGRNLFDPNRMSQMGFEYYGIGKQVNHAEKSATDTAPQLTDLQMI